MKYPAKRARIWIALALCLTLLTACTSGGDQKAAAFEQAKSLLASGRISDAASAFAQLTGYEDAIENAGDEFISAYEKEFEELSHEEYTERSVTPIPDSCILHAACFQIDVSPVFHYNDMKLSE